MTAQVRGSSRVLVRGAALLLVLWLVAMLAALVGAFALIAQMEHLQGQVLFRGVVARQVARAGLDYAMERLAHADPRVAWVPDGRPYAFAYRDAEVELRVVDEHGKVDLNLADHPMLTGLLQATGSDRGSPTRLPRRSSTGATPIRSPSLRVAPRIRTTRPPACRTARRTPRSRTCPNCSRYSGWTRSCTRRSRRM